MQCIKCKMEYKIKKMKKKKIYKIISYIFNNLFYRLFIYQLFDIHF